MAITTRAQLVSKYGIKQAINFLKTGAALTINLPHSCFRVGTNPAAGAVPGAAVLCNNATAGALAINAAPTGLKNYLSEAEFYQGAGGGAQISFELHDRLAHMGGLSGTVITAQTVAVNLLTLAPSAARLGNADYSGVQWWFEWYTATGATAVNASVGVTYNDGTTGTETVAFAANMGSAGSFRLLPIPVVAGNGKFIRSVDSVTLSASTLTAGSFGVTATRQITNVVSTEPLTPIPFSYETLGFPSLENDGCYFFIETGNSTNSGAVSGKLTVVTG